jgi:hypothetical protein
MPNDGDKVKELSLEKTMTRQIHSIRFLCPSCKKRLKVREALSGCRCICPACVNLIKVPLTSGSLIAPPTSAAPAPPTPPVEEPLVPVEIVLPRNMGGLRTMVSRNDAGMMGHTLIGGLIALAGVLLCAFFGLQLPKGRG